MPPQSWVSVVRLRSQILADARDAGDATDAGDVWDPFAKTRRLLWNGSRAFLKKESLFN